MQLNLNLQGEDATEQTLFSLEDWIKQEQISDLKIQTKSGVPQPGNMGVDPISILSVVLASKAVVELVKCIHAWIQATRPKVKVKLQLSEFKTVEIDAENLPDVNSLIAKISADLQETEE